MGVGYRLSDEDWLYYCCFVEMALELHGDRDWRQAAPMLEAAWERGGCSAPWEDVAMLLRTQWARRPQRPAHAADAEAGVSLALRRGIRQAAPAAVWRRDGG